jgi:hypothetical protein
MGTVIPIHSRRKFTRQEAEEILPIVKRITARTAATVDDLQDEMKFVPKDEPLYTRLVIRMQSEVKLWATRVFQLGCEPTGIWLVDFDAGDGWFSWRLGDDDLAFFNTHTRSGDMPSFGDLGDELTS